MNLTFKNDHIAPQLDPYVCKIPSGWAMYVTGIDGVHSYFCDTPFGQWGYRGGDLSKAGMR